MGMVTKNERTSQIKAFNLVFLIVIDVIRKAGKCCVRNIMMCGFLRKPLASEHFSLRNGIR
ncbi:hypothetical protein AL536_02295 [Vibrio fluvialis]|uniref:Uncharacterized protein n=1 Tax=Vibrio fluvialis TaxID=676 RepID=A0ABM5XHD0_VIBFL|nr:hypothetical protein AL536_02295 [Vibrio fluvialis]EKO4009387.1 hypothetical protein [Vibrio fluvialis]